MPDVSESFLNLFRQLASDRLKNVIIAVERLRVDGNDSDATTGLGREFHTLKGEARLLGRIKIAHVAQRTEEVVAYATKLSFQVDESVWQLISEGAALCSSYVDDEPEDKPDLPPEVIAFGQRVDALIGGSKQPPPAPAKKVLTPASVRPLRIVVAEDSVLTLAMVKESLESKGWEVLGARDGVEAIALVRERGPDALVTDLDMPRMNGFDLIRAVRAEPSTTNLPVFILTSSGADSDRDLGRSLRVEAYLQKTVNFDPDMITEPIVRVFGQ